MKCFLTTWLLLSGAMSAMASTAVDASEFENDSVKLLREVNVWGMKSPSTLMPLSAPDLYLPISTQVVTAQSLDDRNITDIQQASKLIPAVKNRTTYGGFQEFYIRGFANQLVAVDGIPDLRSFITSMPIHDLTNVDNIELMRGSASALYGQSIVGGLINITRKQPTAYRQIKSRIGVGSWNTRNAYFSMSGPAFGPVNYFASISHANSDGWRGNKEKRFSIYATANAWLTKNDYVQLTYDFANDFYATDTGLPRLMPYDIYNTDGSLYLKKYEMLPGLDRKARYNNESDFLFNRSQSITAKYQHNFSEAVKIRDVFMFHYDNINYLSTEGMSYLTSDKTISNHYYMAGGEKIYIDLDTLVNNSPLRFNHVAYGYANRLDIFGTFKTGIVKHSYFGGYEFNYLHRPSYGWTRTKDISGPGVNSHIPTYNPYSGGFINAPLTKVNLSDRYSHGIYLSDMIDVVPQFKAMGSVRLDFYKYRSASGIPLEVPNVKKWEAPDHYNSIKNTALTYRLGAVYMPTSFLSIFASAGTFFRPINTLYNDNTIYIDKDGNRYYPSDGAEVFKPEKGYQFEGGVKVEKNGFKGEIDYFYIHKDNVVTSLGRAMDEGVEKNVTGQVGRMHSTGFDVDLSYTWQTLSLNAGYSYTHARVGKLAKNSYVEINADRGNKYTYVPENQFYFGADYELDTTPLRGLGAALSVSYQDKVYTNLSDNLFLKGYCTVDLSLRYRLHNGVEVMATVNNLFNTKYYYSCLGTQLMPGPETNYKLTLGYTF